MKLVRKGVLLLALAGVIVLASSAIDLVRASMIPAPAPQDRTHSHESAAHESWSPSGPPPGFAPANASWGGVFNGNWR